MTSNAARFLRARRPVVPPVHVTRVLLGIAVAISGLACSGIDTFNLNHLATSWVTGASQSPKLSGSLDFGTFHPADNPQLANAERKDIDSIRSQEVWLQVIDPANGQDLRFIEAIDIYVSATGKDPKLVAAGAGFGVAENPVKLKHASSDLTDFALAEEMTISAKVKGKAPPQNTMLQADVRMLVDVAVLGF